MKIFLDTADAESIRRWVTTGLIDGVTTNPSHLSKQSESPDKALREICTIMKGHDVSIEVTEQEPQAVYEQAHRIAALADNVVVKIPCSKEYVTVIKKLVHEGIALNITLIFSALQGLMMAKLGVRYISPFIGRIDDIGYDGIEVISDLRDILILYGFETELLAASIRSISHIHQVAVLGVDIATIPVDLLEKSLEHPLTERGMVLFDADWKKLGITHFP